MKPIISIIALLFALTTHAEWYYVTSVADYNKISAYMVDGPTNNNRNVTIRIANLEKIEDIQNDRTKVLLGGAEPKELLRDIFLNQVVWVDQLKVENGENVAHVYPSYDRVLRVFTKRRTGGTHSIEPAVRNKLEKIYTRMLARLASESPDRNTMPSNGGGTSPAGEGVSSVGNRNVGWYENEYDRALFTYDALDWFKRQGQYLPVRVQALYVDWLSDYQNASGSGALALEIKILDMQQKSDLYLDFIFDS